MAGVIAFQRPEPELEDISELLEAEAPNKLAEQALYGVTGRIIKKIMPHTESCEAALLVSFIVGFGNLVHRTCHTSASASKHRLNFYGALVGTSSAARKGTSWNYCRMILEALDPDWAKNNIASGLTSGEGIIHAVRDPTTKPQPPKDGTKYQGADLVVDPGITDKRLLVMESEFSQCLRVMQRDGNTLSPVIRSAWDGSKLQVMSRNSAAVASDSHISILAHITQQELRAQLSKSDSSNGFGNRFLWACVHRSKYLPNGGQIDAVDFTEEISDLRRAVDFARTTGGLKRDSEAEELWTTAYYQLTEERVGLFASLTSRAEAQTLRLSLLFAVMDCSPQIKKVHLEAALAVWQYVEDSARYIFHGQEASGDAEEVFAVMKKAEGMTKTQIHKAFNGHLNAEALAEALSHLKNKGLIVCAKQTSPKGKPLDVWHISNKNSL